MHGANVAGANHANVHFRLLGHRRDRAVLNGKRLIRPALAVQRQGIDNARGTNTGKGADAVQGILKKMNLACRRSIPIGGERNGHGE